MTESAPAAASPRPAGRGRADSSQRRGITAVPARVVTFIRQVVAELRKVIWPTRNELITYTSVVLVFVTIMVLIVAGFDFAFTQGVLAVFGN